MSYKTIITVLQSEAHIERALPAAIDLAVRHEAHLIGLHVMPGPLIIPTWGLESVAGLLALAKENA